MHCTGKVEGDYQFYLIERGEQLNSLEKCTALALDATERDNAAKVEENDYKGGPHEPILSSFDHSLPSGCRIDGCSLMLLVAGGLLQGYRHRLHRYIILLAFSIN